MPSKRTLIISTISWMVFVAVVSLLPSDRFKPLESWNFLGRDKVGHMAVYGIMAGLWFLWKSSSTVAPISKWAMLGVAVGIPFLYGMMMELAQQTFQASRAAEFADMVANLIGAVFVFSLMMVTHRKKFVFPPWPKQ